DDAAFDVFSYEFTDNDGDIVSGSNLTVTISDDTPVMSDITAGTLAESSLSNGTDPDSGALTLTGNLIDGSGNQFGADGGFVSNVMILGGSTDINTLNNTITVTTAEDNILVVN